MILGLRKKFDLFANLRPLRVWPGTESFSPLKPELVKGMDVLIIRELVSEYISALDGDTSKMGNRLRKKRIDTHGTRLRELFESRLFPQRKEKNRLTVVDKANVLETSRLWREVVRSVQKDFPSVAVDFMFIDNATVQLVKAPATFDVIVTDNMFGDILSDLGGSIVGSLGLLPSASLNEKKFGLYEPVHGSAPDIAGKGIANPTAQILSLAMLLRHTFDLQKRSRRNRVGGVCFAYWLMREPKI